LILLPFLLDPFEAFGSAEVLEDGGGGVVLLGKVKNSPFLKS